MKPDKDDTRLSRKIIQGGLWIFGLRIISRGLGFVRTIILARLLSPNDFGLVGIAMLSLSIFDTFSQTGFHAALIQKKENVERYLDTAWTVLAMRGTFLFAIVFLSAPFIAQFFSTPESTFIIRTVALSTMLTGFNNIGIIFFQKELTFHKQFFYDLSGIIVDIAVSMILAFTMKSAWALVFGGMAGNFIRLIVSYVIHPYRPHVRFCKSEIKELFGFGKWVFGSSILIFLITQGDDIFVGRMLGITYLGLYQMAYTISNLPTTEITHVISQVTMPAYSKLQDNLPKVKETYLNVLQLTTLISFPLAGGIFILAPDFVRLFMGEKWMGMVGAIQILSMAGLIRSIAATTGPVFYGIGKPKIDTLLQIIRLFILVCLIYPFSTKWDIAGTSMAVLSSILVVTIGFSYKVIQETKCGGKIFLKIISFPFISTLIMTLILHEMRGIFQPYGMIQFIGHIMIGAGTYLMTTFLFDKYFDCGIKEKFNILGLKGAG